MATTGNPSVPFGEFAIQNCGPVVAVLPYGFTAAVHRGIRMLDAFRIGIQAFCLALDRKTGMIRLVLVYLSV